MEYWITDTDVIYCDGDSGVDVPNHALVVQDTLLQQLLDAATPAGPVAAGLLDICRIAAGRIGVVDRIMLREELFRAADAVSREPRARESIPWFKQFDDDVAAWLCQQCKISSKLWDLAVSESCVDKLRLYGLRKFGWVRFAKQHFEVWAWSRKTHAQMLRGLDEILEQEGIEPDSRLEFALHVRRSGKWASGIPYADFTQFSKVPRYFWSKAAC